MYLIMDKLSPPKVSVVCAWYNRADYIEATLNSLLDQDFDSYEIIIVNDGSPDPRVKRILDAYKDPRLKVFHQKNSGFVSALSKAIELSCGEFIAIQGAGDISYRERIGKQYDYLIRNPKVGALGAGYAVSSQSSSLLRYRKPLAKREAKELSRGVPFTHGTVMYRRTIYQLAGGYDPRFKYCSDWELYFRILKISKIEGIDKILYKKIEFDDGFSFDPQKKLIQYEYSLKARGGAQSLRFLKGSRRFTYVVISISQCIKSIRSKRFKRSIEWLKKIPLSLSGRELKSVDSELFWKRN